ncbi:hypothetical protein P3L47_11485 [Parabacteroides chongii]|nr:hypothetical protein [Parabacteroides chongii]WFE82779.1 hypothetical protein P3L47_11485 [Parabacteroides chongii]
MKTRLPELLTDNIFILYSNISVYHRVFNISLSTLKQEQIKYQKKLLLNSIKITEV